MKNASIRCHVGSALGGTACLLLAGFFAGCSEQDKSPMSATPVSAKNPAACMPIDTSVTLAVAAVATAAKPVEPAAAKTESKSDETTTSRSWQFRLRCLAWGQER